MRKLWPNVFKYSFWRRYILFLTLSVFVFLGLFSLFFSVEYRSQEIKIGWVWILTADHVCRNLPLYQMCHNLCTLLLKWAKPASFCLFSFVSHDKYSTNLTINDKGIVSVLGIQTWSGRMVGVDESTELWRHFLTYSLSVFSICFFSFLCLFLPFSAGYIQRRDNANRWYVEASVTRFGEISPLWHDFKNLRQIIDALFSIWQNFNLTLGKIAIGQVFIVTDGHMLWNNLAIWSHWLKPTYRIDHLDVVVEDEIKFQKFSTN